MVLLLGTLAWALQIATATSVPDAGNWQVRYQQALTLRQKGEPQRAAEELRAVLLAEPDFAAAHDTLGLVLVDLGDLEGAVEEFKSAVRSQPGFVDAYENLSHVLDRQKRFTAAIYYLQQALVLPLPAEVADKLNLELAVDYGQNGNYKQAIETLLMLVASHPNSSDLHFNLGNAYAHAMRYEDAAKEYQACLRLNGEDSEAMLSAAKAYVIVKEYGPALSYALEYTDRKPQVAEGYLILGEAYRGLTKNSEAISALRRAVQLDPSNYDAHYNLGLVLDHEGDHRLAIQELEQAISLDRDAPEALYALGIILEKDKGKNAGAVQMQAFERAKAKQDQKRRAEDLNNQANQLLKAGDLRGATREYHQAAELEPANSQIHFNLALALARLPDVPNEEKELKEAIRLDPNFERAHYQLGLVLIMEAKDDLAERELQTALAISPADAEAENNLGVLYAREGKDVEAAAILRQATEHNSNFVQAYLNLGLVLAQGGQYTAAEEALRHADRLSPGNAAVRSALQMVEAKLGGTHQ